jgi:hypothetical protein
LEFNEFKFPAMRHWALMFRASPLSGRCCDTCERQNKKDRDQYDERWQKLCSDKITKDKAKTEEVKSTFAALTPKIKDQGGLTVEIISEDITGDTATVTFDLRYGNGQVEPCKYRLIREQGEWRHDGNA